MISLNIKKNKFLLVLVLFVSLTLSAQTGLTLERGIPENEGISSKAILTFIKAAEEKVDALHSLMIVKNGKVVSEGWWAPYQSNSPHELWSLSKSFTSTAIGFAVQEGLLSTHDLVMSFFPKKTPKNPSWQLKQLRIIDLLTMSSGHMKEPMLNAMDSDWEHTFLNSDIPFMPGTHYLYNTPASYMLSAILQQVTGEKLVDYLQPRLFAPLGIEKPEWEMNTGGVNTGGWGLHLKTEDVAKFGQFYLQLGNWNGKQLLPTSWIKMATSKQVSNGSNPNNDWTQGYGFQFWRSRHNSYRADGAMGQFCLIFPEHQTVVSITSGTNDMQTIMQLVWDIILPALKATSLPLDFAAYKTLKEKTVGLALKPVIGMTSSKAQKKWLNKKFTIAQNIHGIKSFTFKMGEQVNFLLIETEDETDMIPFGFGEYVKSELTTPLPFTQTRRSDIVPKSSLRYQKIKKIAASGAWLSHNEFKLTAYLYETPVRMNYKFAFSNQGLMVECTADHYLGRNNTPRVLKSVEHE